MGFGDRSDDRPQPLAEMADTIDHAPRALGLDPNHLLGASFVGALATRLA